MELIKIRYRHEEGFDYVCQKCIDETGYWFGAGECPYVDYNVRIAGLECPVCHSADD
jgi:hypothetical protein